MSIIKTAAEIFRRYVTAGVPASGPNPVNKDDVQAWGTFLETMLGAGLPGLAYATLAAINADLAHGANSLAIVYGDTTAANNGEYVKAGVSGSGSWSRIGDLPTTIVPLTVTGGTGNAIVAVAPESPTTPGLKLFVMTPTANNSGATTLAYNAVSALPIKDAFGAALVGGELLNASPVIMLGASDHFTLLLSTNVDASAILTSAQAAQTAAAASASAASGSATAAAASAAAAAGTGSLVASAYAEYTVNTALTATIPLDDTIPQSAEGIEILNVSITPKSTTNKLRVRFTGQAAVASADIIACAMFLNSETGARVARHTSHTTGFSETVCLEHEFVPGSTSAQTIRIRVGCGGAGAFRFNGSSSARLFGGVARTTLIVEEIKA